MPDPEPETTPNAITPGPPAPPRYPPSRPEFEFRQRPSTVPVERAAVVMLSARLWFAAGVLLLIAGLIMLLDLGAIEAGVRTVVDRDFPNELPATRDRAVAVAGLVLMGVGIVVGLAEAGFAALLLAGRSGARLALVVLLTLSVLETVLSLGVVPAVSTFALVLAVSCGVAGAVTMFMPVTNAWLAARHH